jgi:hypothetical protein
MKEKIMPEDDRKQSTSDNRYRGYTAEEVAQLVGRTSARIRQIALEYHIGTKYGKRLWTFTADDVILMGSKTQQGRKSAMRDVTPRTKEEADAILSGQDLILAQLRSGIEGLRREAFRLITDVNLGIHNRISKIDEHYDKRIYILEQRVREIESKKNEGRRGRAAFTLPRTTRLTLTYYEAEAA